MEEGGAVGRARHIAEGVRAIRGVRVPRVSVRVAERVDLREAPRSRGRRRMRRGGERGCGQQQQQEED